MFGKQGKESFNGMQAKGKILILNGNKNKIIIILLLGVFVINYINIYNKNINLEKQLNIIKKEQAKERFDRLFISPLIELYIFNKLDKKDYIDSLYITTLPYFCYISENNNKDNLSQLKKQCFIWYKNMKIDYKNKFVYLKGKRETDAKIEKFYSCAIKGLEIVDSVCGKLKK